MKWTVSNSITFMISFCLTLNDLKEKKISFVEVLNGLGGGLMAIVGLSFIA